jgi:hypothetical protein
MQPIHEVRLWRESGVGMSSVGIVSLASGWTEGRSEP